MFKKSEAGLFSKFGHICYLDFLITFFIFYLFWHNFNKLLKKLFGDYSLKSWWGPFVTIMLILVDKMSTPPCRKVHHSYWQFVMSIFFLKTTPNYSQTVIHRTFPHIFSIQVKSGTCYITGQWGRVQNKIK